jgi:tetratricopeptide (TPR) repeat protein
MKLSRSLPLVLIFIFSHWHALRAQDNLTGLYFSGNYHEVVESAAALITLGDTTLNIFYLKALSEAQLGLPQKAIETLQNALLLHPGEKRISRMLARQYFDAGDYVKARQGYRNLVQTDSTDISSWLRLAEIASFRQQLDQAKNALTQVLSIDSLNMESLMMMGDILNRYNNSDAVIYYERAFHLYPDNQKAAYALGNWYLQAKDVWKTIPICEHMLKIDSTSIKFSKLLGYAYYKTGEPGNAVPWFDKAISLGDSTSFTYKFKGISQYLLVDFAGAIESLDLAVKKDSLDAEVHFFLGASLGTTTSKREAMFHLEKSLKLMQPDPSVITRI